MYRCIGSTALEEGQGRNTDSAKPEKWSGKQRNQWGIPSQGEMKPEITIWQLVLRGASQEESSG